MSQPRQRHLAPVSFFDGLSITWLAQLAVGEGQFLGQIMLIVQRVSLGGYGIVPCRQRLIRCCELGAQVLYLFDEISITLCFTLHTGLTQHSTTQAVRIRPMRNSLIFPPG